MERSVKRLAVLGSTGSIGQQTLAVVRALPQRFRVVALAAGGNTALLKQQVSEFQPELGYCTAGGEGTGLSLEEMAAYPGVDVAVIATAGKAGLAPVLAAARAGKTIALANKEALVMAGGIIIAEAERRGAKILPVDSEHSAIWQCLLGEVSAPERLILTASGGPFRRYPAARLTKVTAAQALRHPSWKMGKKVTIDSATLMNKGLEIIEAHWLFRMPLERIRVLVHPQSIVHSLVEFADGSVKAQLGCPDMRLPIQFALTYPERVASPELPRLDWDSLKTLDFEPPDGGKFPCLGLAREAARLGGTFPAVLGAADEAAVALFLDGKIGFMDIPRLVGKVLAQHQFTAEPDIEDIMAADGWARRCLLELAGGKR